MPEPDAHLEERAELYALGQLDESERAALERHVTSCAQCRESLADAEATVLRMIEAHANERSAPVLTPLWPHQPRRRFALPLAAALALAAAVAIAIFNWNGLRAARDVRAQQQLAMTAMIQGHFLHAPLVAQAPGAPAGKVLYGRTGGWIYVVVEGGTEPLDVIEIDAKGRHTVAKIPADPAARSAFVRLDAPARDVELSSNGTTIASAHVATVKER